MLAETMKIAWEDVAIHGTVFGGAVVVVILLWRFLFKEMWLSVVRSHDERMAELEVSHNVAMELRACTENLKTVTERSEKVIEKTERIHDKMRDHNFQLRESVETLGGHIIALRKHCGRVDG